MGSMDLILSTGSTLADWQRLLHAQTSLRQAAMEREEAQRVLSTFLEGRNSRNKPSSRKCLAACANSEAYTE
jgi:hypothetical protein